VLFCVVLADGVVDRQESRGFASEALKAGEYQVRSGPVPQESSTTGNYFIVA
jgi:hypothetical protein